MTDKWICQPKALKWRTNLEDVKHKAHTHTSQTYQSVKDGLNQSQKRTSQPYPLIKHKPYLLPEEHIGSIKVCTTLWILFNHHQLTLSMTINFLFTNHTEIHDTIFNIYQRDLGYYNQNLSQACAQHVMFYIWACM